MIAHTPPGSGPQPPRVAQPEAPALELELEGRVGSLSIVVALTAGAGPLLVAGPNGAGKSTLLGMLLGIVPARGGRVVVGGRVLFDSARGIDLLPEERGLGYVPQQYALFPQRTALANVAFGLECKSPRPPAAEIARRAQALLDALEVGHAAGRLPAALSGGERQRVALARALAPEPRALLLDEPLAALDSTVRGKVRAFLAQRLRALSLPALVVTHDPADAAALGDQVAVLERGRVVQVGTLAALAEHPATDFAGEFATAALRERSRLAVSR